MTKHARVSVMCLSVLTVSALPRGARALTVPDTGTCNNPGGTCLGITTNSNAAPLTTFVATANNSGGCDVPEQPCSTAIVGEVTQLGGYGVMGYAPNGGAGLVGVSGLGLTPGQFLGGNVGVYASTNSGNAVYADAGTGIGVNASSSSNYGLYASTGTGVSGIYGTSTSTIGIYGNSGSSYGVAGVSQSAQGVFGFSYTGNGLWGTTQSTSNAAVAAVAPSSGCGSTGCLAFYGSGGIQVTGTAYKPGGGMWQATGSDSRVKKDIRSFDPGLGELMRVRAVQFKYNGLGGLAEDGKDYVGVIAQELEKVMPTMVGTRMAKLHPTDMHDTAIKTVDPSDFTYLLINAVQEQERVIQRQEARIAALEQGQRPLASSRSSFGTGVRYGALALFPLGLVVAVRGRKKQG